MATLKEKVDLGNGYSKDDTSVYFYTWIEKESSRDMLVKDVDLDTFFVLKWKYAKDKKNVYFYGKKIEGVDLNSFEIIKEGGEKDPLAKDKNSVYWRGQVIQDADPKTFININGSYRKDRNHAYYIINIIKGVDPKTFVTLDILFAKDKNSVYYQDKIISKADPVTFQHLGQFYSKDKNFVYYKDEILKEADLKTFRFVGKHEIMARDKNNEYWLNKIIDDYGCVDIPWYSSYGAKDAGELPRMIKTEKIRRTVFGFLIKKIKRILNNIFFNL